METVLSVASIPRLEDYVIKDGLSEEMCTCLLDYLLTLRCSESTQLLYLQRLRQFGLWLMKNGITSYHNVTKADVERFLATYSKNNTKNGHITALKPFYRFLGKREVTKKVKFYDEDLEPITRSIDRSSIRVVLQCPKIESEGHSNQLILWRKEQGYEPEHKPEEVF